jgi:hypothetical protein
MGNVKKPGEGDPRFLKGSVSWGEQPRPSGHWARVHASLAEDARLKDASKASEPEQVGDAEVLPRRRGRPPLPEGMMLDVTLRMPRELLDRADAMIENASDWREFRRILPTRSGVLRLAMTLGLEQLALRKQAAWDLPASEVMQFQWQRQGELPAATAEPLVSAFRSAWAEKPTEQVEQLRERDDKLHEMILLLAKEVEILKLAGASRRTIGGESIT